MAQSDALNIYAPVISTAYDELLTHKKRAVIMRQGVCGSLQATMLRDGKPIDLNDLTIATEPDSNRTVGEQDWEDFGWNDWDTFMFIEGPLIPPECSHSSHESESSCALTLAQICVRWREASLMDKTIYQNTGVVFDADNGIVRVEVPEQVRKATGIYLVEFGIFAPDDEELTCPLFTNELFFLVEHSSWHNPQTHPQKGPPVVGDIRLSLRDGDPEMNELIDTYDFDLAEICWCAVRVIQFWNDQPPLIRIARFSTKNFPFREIWLKGIHLFLFELAEEHYRRNRLPYSAGGVNTDDKARAREYNQAWKERHASFRQMVMHQKAQINASQCWSSLGSGYGYGGSSMSTRGWTR